MVESFVTNGWCVQIRGPESGGKVENLPIHNFDVGKGTELKIPTEILIPETREFEFANQGFIPLSYYKGRNYACFFSANSAQKPEEYDSADATANCRINSRLPYIFLTSRLAHYLKVLQRENIGASKSASDLEQELNSWIKSLVTQMKNPGPELAATHPLSYGEVKVAENEDNPGFFKVSLAVVPHFQVEGIDVNLSLVSKLPQGK
jgi:type VI secretion system protein ImpC